MASLEVIWGHAPQVCKLARCTEIEFCVNSDHINSIVDKMSHIFTLKIINSDDSPP